MSEELKAAQARIAGLDDIVLSLQCKVIERDAELAALKAQEPVAWIAGHKLGDLKQQLREEWLPVWNNQKYGLVPLYAAPVVSAEQQGVPDGWIPVSERLPLVDGQYWCFFSEEHPSTIKQRVCIFIERHQQFCDWTVTHWMPLPATPATHRTHGAV